jgi:hypothetical protein
MYPLLAHIQERTPEASLREIRTLAACLESVLISHANIEDQLLRPRIEPHLPPPAQNPDGSPGPTDHQVIREWLTRAATATEITTARAYLLRTIQDTLKHFEKEETRIFEIAEKRLTPRTQQQLGTEWAQRRGVRLEVTLPA